VTVYQRLLRLEALLDGKIEFGSGGMMRQSRVLASLSRENNPAMKAAADQAAARIRQRLDLAVDRSYRARTIPGIEEKLRLTDANKERIGRYQARLGLR
jgi:hypothetical protein